MPNFFFFSSDIKKCPIGCCFQNHPMFVPGHRVRVLICPSMFISWFWFLSYFCSFLDCFLSRPSLFASLWWSGQVGLLRRRNLSASDSWHLETGIWHLSIWRLSLWIQRESERTDGESFSICQRHLYVYGEGACGIWNTTRGYAGSTPWISGIWPMRPRYVLRL